MTNNDFYWYWFTNIAGIGVKTQKKLLEHFGHPSTIYNAPESEIKGILTTGQCKGGSEDEFSYFRSPVFNERV